MKYRIIAFFSALVILFSSTPIYVSASSGGGGSRQPLTGYDTWSAGDKFSFWLDNLWAILGNCFGVFMNAGRWTLEDIHGAMEAKAYEKYLAEDCDNFQEYVLKHTGVNDNGEYCVDNELADVMYEAVNIYIEEYTGWYNYQTIDYRNISASNFPSQGLYNAFVSHCTQQLKGTDNMLVFINVSGAVNGVHYVPVTNALSDVEYYVRMTDNYGCRAYITQNWQTKYCNSYKLEESGLTETIYTQVSDVRFGSTGYMNYLPVTDGARTVRVYKSLEDLKSYSVGQRPYFTTSKFQDYDINGDNSCIISESQLNGSSVYGDVINYIIEYPDSDGLTEDELRDILDDYFKDKEDNDDSGSGPGGSGGSGLGGFLDGIGAIGDALLGILGKLLEYVGKAIDLLSETVTKVIDIIPKNITALLGGIFPFLPEEWLTAIELSLVLAVIVGIVRIFKG